MTAQRNNAYGSRGPGVLDINYYTYRSQAVYVEVPVLMPSVLDV